MATTEAPACTCPECRSFLTDRTTDSQDQPTYCDTCDREVALTDDDRHIFETLEFTPVLSQFINWNTIGDRATQFWCNVDVRRRSDGSTVVTLWAVK